VSSDDFNTSVPEFLTDRVTDRLHLKLRELWK